MLFFQHIIHINILLGYFTDLVFVLWSGFYISRTSQFGHSVFIWKYLFSV